MANSRELQERLKRVSVSFGPGQFIDEIEGILADSRMLYESFRTYPKLLKKEFADGREVNAREFRHFRLIEHATWATWNRLPYFGRFKTPKSYLYGFADRIIEKNLRPCDVFIGWSQVSLHSMRRARDFGAKVILEHHQANVQKWNELVTEEYREWGMGTPDFHSIFPSGLVERMEKEYHAADVIDVISTFAKNSFLENGTPEDKLRLLLLGIDTDRFSPGEYQRQEDTFRILYVGRLELLKGIQYLLKAFKEIRSRHVELQLVGQVLPEVKAALRQFRDDRVKVVGPVPNRDLPHYYRNADLFVFPSVNDAFGLVVLEAMASGLPVVTTVNSCGHDVVTDGVDGFVIPIRDPKAISETIQYFLEDRNETRVMGERAKAKVLSEFSIEHFRDRLLSNINNT